MPVRQSKLWKAEELNCLINKDFCEYIITCDALVLTCDDTALVSTNSFGATSKGE